MSTLHPRMAAAGLAIGLAIVAGACGGDDDADAAPDTADSIAGEATDDAAGDSAAGGTDELALGDPCDLVTGTEVGEIVGGDAAASLTNVDDGLPGATCLYTLDSGTISLSITPDGAGFYDSYRAQAEASGGVEAVDGLGDEGFVYQGTEVVSRAGEAMIQLQVFTSATTASTGGVDVVAAAVEAIAG